MIIGEFNAVNAKMSAMASKFLKDEDYINMARLNSVSQIIEYLKNTSLSFIFDGDEDSFEAEKKLQVYRINTIKKLSKYFKGVYREFALELLNEFTIMDIKKILRTLKIGDGARTLESRLITLNYRDYDIKNNSSIADFIGKIKNKEFVKILKPYADEKDDIVLFYMEMNLDKFFYTKLFNLVKNFDRQNKKPALELLGIRIDLLNIIWIYRGLKYYDLSPEELINFTVLGGHYLSFDDLKDLSYSRLDKFVEKIKSGPYKFLFDGTYTDIYMDRRNNRYIYYLAKSDFLKNSDFSKFMAFILLLNYEIKDLTSVMESRRFNMSLNRSLNYLVRSYKGSEQIWL